MSSHVVSWKVYLAVFLALSALTVITVQVAGHDFGPFNLVVALGVAITKATLVVLYFCLLYTSPSPRDRQKSRMPSSA